MKVADYMTKNVVTIDKNVSIRDAILKLRKAKISGMPVLDGEKVVGVFSEADLLNQLPDILEEADLIPMIDVQELTGAPVKDVMGYPAITCTPTDNLKDVAKIFLEKFIHRLPVIDTEEKLVGVISLGDVLKAFIEEKGKKGE